MTKSRDVYMKESMCLHRIHSLLCQSQSPPGPELPFSPRETASLHPNSTLPQSASDAPTAVRIGLLTYMTLSSMQLQHALRTLETTRGPVAPWKPA